MSVRDELAAAASTVDGVTATPFYRQTTEAGSAFIRLDRIDYPDRFGGVRTWNVVVVLPQDLAEAEQYLEAKLPGLLEALEPHMTVREVVPQRLSITDVGALPCVFINGSREEN
ncbi:hypothetical protein GCM10027596_26710 [Nocardioides korecus]